MMHIRIGSTLAIATAMALSGCGGGSGTEPLPRAVDPTHGVGALAITIKVPKPAKMHRGGLRPNYISPSTKSLTVAIDSGTPVAYGLTPTSSGCVAASGSTPLTCTVRLSLAAGTHTGTFKTYDGANGTGNLLSAHTGVSLTIQPGQANSLGLVLDGEIASIALSLANPAPQQGTAATIPLTVNAYDADNNLIIGPGSYDYLPITLSDSDTSGATTLSTTTVSDPSTNVTVTYNGNAIPAGSATFSASEGTVVTSTSQEAVLTPFSLGTWTTLAPMPTARFELAAGVINDVLYAVGGENAVTEFSTLEAFEPKTNAWTTKAPIPPLSPAIEDGIFDFGAGVVDDTLYLVGGAGFGTLNTVEAYDPSTDSWTAKASMPTARTGLAVGVVNGKLYAVGGDSGSTLNTVEEYDPSTNTWTVRPPMPTARGHLAVGVVNGLLYAIGGWDPDPYHAVVYYDKVEAYDPSANAWIEKAPMPAARAGLAASVVNGTLYAVGGSDANGVHNEVFAYDPTKNEWTKKAAMPTARALFAGGVVNNVLYAVGGTGNVDSLNTVEAFTP